MKHFISLSLLLSILLCLLIVVPELKAQIPNPCGTSPCVQIGTYNIEWLGGPPDKHRLRSRGVIRQIAEFIAVTLDLEVVILEEINTSSREYDWLVTELERYGYQIKQAGDTAQQDIVLAFDTDEVQLLSNGVQELDVRDEFNLPGNCRTNRKLRLPLTAHLKAGNFDFLIVGIHLKSQLPVEGANNPEKCADTIREEQCKDINGKISSLITIFQEQDIILVGDFNASIEDTSLNPLLQSTGFKSLVEPNMRDANSSSYSYIPIQYRSLIDHLMINTIKTDEWVRKSSFIFNPPQNPQALNNYLDWFSDHTPAWAWFKTNQPDND